MNEIEENSINISVLFSILRKRIVLIVVMTIFATAIGGVYTFFIARPVYSSTTQLVVKSSSDTSSANNVGNIQGNLQLINTINQVIVSPAILNKVKDQLNLTESVSEMQGNMVASSTTNSTVINLLVKNGKPNIARDIANTTATVFKDEAQSMLGVDNVTILSKAVSNNTPVSPNKKLNIAIAVVIGLVLGVAIGILLEFMDNTIHSEEDIERILGKPLLGTIPLIENNETNLPIYRNNKKNKRRK